MVNYVFEDSRKEKAPNKHHYDHQTKTINRIIASQTIYISNQRGSQDHS
jgi:hypothetical protein